MIEKITLFFLMKKADNLHKMNGKQYFIIPVVTRGKRSYSLMNNELHKAYNIQAKKMGKSQIQYRELLTMAVYQTGVGTLGRR
jgi:hypothetical protein